MLGNTLGQLASGQPVFDRTRSHMHDGIEKSLQDAFDRISLDDSVQFTVIQIDFDQEIGFCNVVSTTEQDTIFYIKRLGRKGLSRFVLGRESEPCQSIVLVLKKAEEGNFFLLITAYIGRISQPEPWDKDSQISREYWNSHAFVMDTEPVDWGTATQQCPWG